MTLCAVETRIIYFIKLRICVMFFRHRALAFLASIHVIWLVHVFWYIMVGVPKTSESEFASSRAALPLLPAVAQAVMAAARPNMAIKDSVFMLLSFVGIQ